VCKNQNTDAANCGGCNKICPQGQPCCAGSCKDASSDVFNCGQCGKVCPASCSGTRQCVGGQCHTPTSAWPIMAEYPNTRCPIAFVTPNAFNQSEAIGCASTQFPGAVVGQVPFPNTWTYCVSCPDGLGGTYNSTWQQSGLSSSDAMTCVQSQNGNCQVTSGACP
jgi:hypothetical protein